MFQPVRKPQGGFASALSILELIYHSIVRSVRKTHNNAFLAIAMNMLRAAIEHEGKRYGPQINRNKCEYILLNRGKPQFPDNTRVPQHETVKYLGCMLNNKGAPTRKVNNRTSACMITRTRLHMFWRSGDSIVKQQIIVV